MSIKQTIIRFKNDCSGATAIEYGLIASGIALSIITSVGALGSSIGNNYHLVELLLSFL